MQCSPATLLVLLALSACSWPDDADGKPILEVETDTAAEDAPVGRLDLGGFAPRNVVVVHVDTLRADALPAWGSEWDTTPELGQRSGWVSVSRAISTTSWTVPSTASLLTGLDLPAHGLRYYDETGPKGKLTAPTFAEHLRARGFATGVFSGSGVILRPDLDIIRGFDMSRDISRDPGNAAQVVTEALSWLETLDPKSPFFVFLQPTDPHMPYRPEDGDLGTWSDADSLPFEVGAPTDVQERQIGEAFSEANDDEERAALRAQVRAVYDEQVLGVDRAVEALIAGLEAMGRGGDTLVVLTADHGETWFEGTPSHLGHANSTRNELVHVPLQFWGQGLQDAHVDCVASNVDVLPTVLDGLGVEPMPDVEGRSLLDGCRSHAFSGAYVDGADGEAVAWLSVHGGGAQLARDCGTGATLAFDLLADPGALRPVDVGTVPGGLALAGELERYAAALETSLPHLECDR